MKCEDSEEEYLILPHNTFHFLFQISVIASKYHHREQGTEAQNG